jgi:pimeloyl-ACP methyl ester carboxylesterase
MKYLCYLFLLTCFAWSCKQEDLAVPENYVNDTFWLRHKQADLLLTARGNAASNTIFVNVHGGPAMGAQYVALRRPAAYQALEEQGIVLYYDQRGIGLSTGAFSDSQISLAQFVEDLDQVVALANYKYGGQNSIFLLSRSWGGLLSSAYLSEKSRQEKISGWINVSGALDMPMIREAGKILLEETARQQIGEEHHPDEWSSILNFAMQYDPESSDYANTAAYWSAAYQGMLLLSQDGVTVEADVVSGLAPDVIRHCTYYSSSEVLQNDAQDLAAHLLQEVGEYAANLTAIRIPTLFIHGAYDLIVPPAVATAGYQYLGTPEKDKWLRVYEEAAHLPMTHHEKFIQDAIPFIQTYQ